MIFTTKQFNTRTALKASLTNEEGLPIDLTGASVSFICDSGINRSAQIQEGGIVWFVFEENEVAAPGLFKAEFHVIYPDNRKEIFPNDGYITVQILESMGGN